MILKKSNRQISWLHVYHHATTLFPCWWAVIRYAPGGDTWYTAFLNSFIHVLMYGYYTASTFGLRLTFLKPMITASQILQFCSFISQVRPFHQCFLSIGQMRQIKVIYHFEIFTFWGKASER
jgi:elongation of very long chain fatty acids protein 4